MAIDLPIQYQRMFKQPLTTQEVFNSMDLAEKYAQLGASYPGQIIAIRTGGVPEYYVITDSYAIVPFPGSGGDSVIIQKPTRAQFPGAGKTYCLYIDQSTSLGWYWDQDELIYKKMGPDLTDIDIIFGGSVD